MFKNQKIKNLNLFIYNYYKQIPKKIIIYLN